MRPSALKSSSSVVFYIMHTKCRQQCYFAKSQQVRIMKDPLYKRAISPLGAGQCSLACSLWPCMCVIVTDFLLVVQSHVQIFGAHICACFLSSPISTSLLSLQTVGCRPIASLDHFLFSADCGVSTYSQP